MIETSIAEIIRTWLVDQQFVTLPSDADDWPCFVDSMNDSPDDALCLYDDDPDKDGRIMKTGEVVLHYGLMIRVRSHTYLPGWQMANEIAEEFDHIYNEFVAMSSQEQYTLRSLSRRGGVIALGLEEGTKRRFLFEAHYTVTLNEI